MFSKASTFRLREIAKAKCPLMESAVRNRTKERPSLLLKSGKAKPALFWSWSGSRLAVSLAVHVIGLLFGQLLKTGLYTQNPRHGQKVLASGERILTAMSRKPFSKMTDEFFKKMEHHAAAEAIRLRKPAHGKLRLIGTSIGALVLILLAVWMAHH